MRFARAIKAADPDRLLAAVAQARAKRFEDAQQSAAEFAIGDEGAQFILQRLGWGSRRGREDDLRNPVIRNAIGLGRHLEYVAIEHFRSSPRFPGSTMAEWVLHDTTSRLARRAAGRRRSRVAQERATAACP